jgi:hypothetical protein
MFCSNSPAIKLLYQVGHLLSREASPTRPMMVHTEKAMGWMQGRALEYARRRSDVNNGRERQGLKTESKLRFAIWNTSLE